MKKCSHCKKTKDLFLFSKSKNGKFGHDHMCKECRNERMKKWRIENHDKAIAMNRANDKTEKRKAQQSLNAKKRYQNNPISREKTKKAVKKWQQLNSQKKKESERKYRQNNREKRKAIRKTPNYRINDSISSSIRYSIKQNKNGIKWEKLVGYSLQNLKKHLQKLFTNEMSFENYGEWHIDHILPLSKFNFEKPEDEDFKKAWALKNLQPLWKKDNLQKGTKLKTPIQNSFIF